MKLKIFSLCFAIILTFSSQLFSQEVIASGGGCFNSSELQISWTLGEPVIETCESGKFCLTQGFHQSILIVTAVSAISEMFVDIKAYPNPITTVINLSVETEKFVHWSYCLFDAEGKLLDKKNIESNHTLIPMQLFVASNYLLQVKKDDRTIKTFKIIKSR
ncbi:MAG: T9SS type A sorting domain-containing protein [Prolixibacteraceae bacterium]|nr:T9SS type A sorting domain-containing protein [Prolixibacteraceae bacterium]